MTAGPTGPADSAEPAPAPEAAPAPAPAPAPAAPARAPDPRTLDRRNGLLIVASAFVASLCLSWWARTKSHAEPGPPPPPTTEGVVGFPRKVEVLASLDGAQALTPRTELRGISAWGVKGDGTLDATEPASRIRYVFGSERGEGPQPPRPPGTLPKRGYCGKQTVHVKGEGFVVDPDQPMALCSAQRGEPLPTPRCGPKEVWKVAIRKGAPADRRATVEYFRAGAGPAWKFDLPGTGLHFVLYGDCERELTGSDAAGSVP